MDGFGIQVSYKTPHGTMVNVRGEDPTEFDINHAHAVEKVTQIHAAEAAFLGLAPQTLQDGVALIQSVMPGTEVIGEYGPPPQGGPVAQSSQQWSQPAPQGGYQQTHCDRCKQAPVCKNCQRPCILTPKSVKEWFVHDCPSGDRSHKGAWCNLPK